MQFKVENFRRDSGTVIPAKLKSARINGGRIKGRFLKGPISWDWLTKAMNLPGKSLHVALILWLEVGFRRTNRVKFRMGLANKAGFSRWTARRALKQLESAGLIETERKPGQLTTVRILDVEVEN